MTRLLVVSFRHGLARHDAVFISLIMGVRILTSHVKPLFQYCFGVSSDKFIEAVSSQVALVLKEEREKRDLSLKALAKKSGISRQTISYVEQEVQSPSLDTLLRITSALGADLAKIIARAQKRTAKDFPPPAES
jgi:DNA-binding XRE family transcriptional regulator